MKYFEFSILYGPKKNPLQHCGRAIAKDLGNLMRSMETDLFVLTGKWQTIRDGLITEITDEKYFNVTI